MKPNDRWMAVATLALIAAGCGGNDGIGGEVIGSGTVTVQDVQVSVFTPHCATAGCHAGAAAPFGLDLGAGNALGNTVGVPSSELPAFERVTPGDAGDSYLFMKVSGDPRILGDPMPASGAPLNSQKLQLLADWIEQGASP